MKHFPPLLDIDLANKLSTEKEVVFLDMEVHVEVLDKLHTLKMETTILINILKTHHGDQTIATITNNLIIGEENVHFFYTHHIQKSMQCRKTKLKRQLQPMKYNNHRINKSLKLLCYPCK
jgi:hypothetical protein